MRLANKVAVITGAGSGMGKAMAQLFSAEGARIICADISGAQGTTGVRAVTMQLSLGHGRKPFVEN